MKDHVKGRVFLPAYIVRDTGIRQEFRAEKVHRKRGAKAVLLKDVPHVVLEKTRAKLI
jgi:hypothetical protein